VADGSRRTTGVQVLIRLDPVQSYTLSQSERQDEAGGARRLSD
jgi:hypothetical protein